MRNLFEYFSSPAAEGVVFAAILATVHLSVWAMGVLCG